MVHFSSHKSKECWVGPGSKGKSFLWPTKLWLCPHDIFAVRCRYGEEGQKERYFADDDTKDLDQLVREQRYGDPGDMDAAFAANVASKSRYRYVPWQQGWLGLHVHDQRFLEAHALWGLVSCLGELGGISCQQYMRSSDADNLWSSTICILMHCLFQMKTGL